MIELRIEQILVERFLNFFYTGNAIEVPPEQWSDNDLLVLAGCCLAILARQSTQPMSAHDGQSRRGEDLDRLTERQHIRECKTAIDVVRDMANFAFDDGLWDNYLKPIEKAIVDHDQFGGGGFRFVDGTNSEIHHFD